MSVLTCPSAPPLGIRHDAPTAPAARPDRPRERTHLEIAGVPDRMPVAHLQTKSRWEKRIQYVRSELQTGLFAVEDRLAAAAKMVGLARYIFNEYARMEAVTMGVALSVEALETKVRTRRLHRAVFVVGRAEHVEVGPRLVVAAEP